MRKIIDLIDKLETLETRESIVNELQAVADEVAAMDNEIDTLKNDVETKDKMIEQIQKTNYDLLKRINNVEDVKNDEIILDEEEKIEETEIDFETVKELFE